MILLLYTVEMVKSTQRTIRLKEALPAMAGHEGNLACFIMHITKPRKTPKGYRVTATLMFSKELCKHTAYHTEPYKAITTARVGAFAAIMEDGTAVLNHTWSLLNLDDPTQDAAWIMNHLTSHNPFLQDLARRAYKTTYSTKED